VNQLVGVASFTRELVRYRRLDVTKVVRLVGAERPADVIDE